MAEEATEQPAEEAKAEAPPKKKGLDLKSFDFKTLLDPDFVKSRVRSLVLGPKDLLGVDIGSHSVKIVQLAGGGKKPKLKAWGVLPLSLPPEADAEARRERAASLIRDFAQKSKVFVREAATSVSGNAVIVRYVTLPYISKEGRAEQLPAEAEPFIPFDIAEVSLGCHVIQEVMEEGQKKMEAVLVAAKNELIDARVETLRAAGLRPAVVDVDSFSLENVHELQAEGQEGAVLYLNLGHSVTNLSIIEGGLTRVVRDIFISGQTFTKAVAKALRVPEPEAEEAKHRKGLLQTTEEKESALADGDRDALGVSVALSQVLKDLVVEIQRSVEFFLSQNPDRHIVRVVLAGGTARTGGLREFLARELTVPVDLLDPAAVVDGGDKIPEESRAALGVAAGLAMRKMKDWEQA